MVQLLGLQMRLNFGGAHVMAFQAPDTWYYAQNDGLLEKAYNEINEVIKD